MTGSYVTRDAKGYALAQELYECVADLEGVDVSRLNGDEVDVERGIRRDGDVLEDVERLKGGDQVGVGHRMVVEQCVAGKTVDLAVSVIGSCYEVLEASNQFQGDVDEKGTFELAPQMQTI